MQHDLALHVFWEQLILFHNSIISLYILRLKNQDNFINFSGLVSDIGFIRIYYIMDYIVDLA